MISIRPFSLQKWHSLLLSLSFCLFTCPVLAQIVTWTGGSGNDWANAANWIPAAVPTASSHVVIPFVSKLPVIDGSTAALASSVEIQYKGGLTISANGSLSINGSKNVIGYTMAFFNWGTVHNYGQLILGNTAALGLYGLWNHFAFTNHAGANIQIDNSLEIGLINIIGATFTNEAQITIGKTASVGLYGLQNHGIFNNNTGSEIQIDNVAHSGLHNFRGTFNNAANINIGATGNTGTIGLWNSSNFNNNSGMLSIDNMASYGILHDVGTFINSAQIIIGAKSSAGSTGIWNQQIFKNSLGGSITIDDVSGNGLVNNAGTFANSGQIAIGGKKSVGNYGIWNQGALTNDTGGQITVDNATNSGVTNNAGTFTNSAQLQIGSKSSTGRYGLQNLAIFQNNSCANLLIARGSFVNEATKITINSGLIDVVGNVTNNGALTNNGVFKYGSLVGEITNNQLVVNDYSTTIFSYGKQFSGTISGIFKGSDANQAAGDFTSPNTFSPALTASGTYTFFAKVKLNSADCSYLIPFKYTAAPLPVTLVSFSGKKTAENQNTLLWITSDEKNFDRFEIQSSGDGKSFEKIGTVLGQTRLENGANLPDQTALQTYNFTDQSAVQNQYYRLKIIDIDNSFTYSRIISIQNATEKPVVGAFYPNPSFGPIYVDIYAVENGTWTVTVCDAAGKAVSKEVRHLQKGMNKLSMEHLGPGVNLVQFDHGKTSEVRKLLMQ